MLPKHPPKKFLHFFDRLKSTVNVYERFGDCFANNFPFKKTADP